MATIRSLLNPMPETVSRPEELSASGLGRADLTADHTSTRSPLAPARKKPKLCKDAAVFSRGPIRGECRYPPDEYQDDVLVAYHQQFELYPMGEIADFPRHIPYNSEKKNFMERTNRESFETFQYQFKVPGDNQVYVMLWDYNIGLVRTTPLFKCTGHSKTTPAKMLNRNPGLREICHSITGGALVAQGYWMPHAAAKAAAATFCWNIRYALTPVFGSDFPSMCISPDSDRFGDMRIDPSITAHCTALAAHYRGIEGGGLRPTESTLAAPTSTAGTLPADPLTPDTPTHPHQETDSQHRQNSGREDITSSPTCSSTHLVKDNNRTRDSKEVESSSRVTSGGSVVSPQQAHAVHPQHDTSGGAWASVNQPRSVSQIHTQHLLPSPRGMLSDFRNRLDQQQRQRQHQHQQPQIKSTSSTTINRTRDHSTSPRSDGSNPCALKSTSARFTPPTLAHLPSPEISPKTVLIRPAHLFEDTQLKARNGKCCHRRNAVFDSEDDSDRTDTSSTAVSRYDVRPPQTTSTSDVIMWNTPEFGAHTASRHEVRHRSTERLTQALNLVPSSPVIHRSNVADHETTGTSPVPDSVSTPDTKHNEQEQTRPGEGDAEKGDPFDEQTSAAYLLMSLRSPHQARDSDMTDDAYQHVESSNSATTTHLRTIAAHQVGRPRCNDNPSVDVDADSREFRDDGSDKYVDANNNQTPRATFEASKPASMELDLKPSRSIRTFKPKHRPATAASAKHEGCKQGSLRGQRQLFQARAQSA